MVLEEIYQGTPGMILEICQCTPGMNFEIYPLYLRSTREHPDVKTMSNHQKILNKIQDALEHDDFYTCQLLYVSLSQRLVLNKKLEEAENILILGFKELMKHEQFQSALTLALKLQDHRSIAIVFDHLPFPFNKQLADSLKPASPFLNHVFGTAFINCNQYYLAESYLVNGTLESARSLGKLAAQWSNENITVDPGYFILRFTLQLLLQNKLAQASISINTFITTLELDSLISLPFLDSKIDFFKSKLLNLSLLLCLVCQRKTAIQEFKALVDGFSKFIQDEYVLDLIDAVGLQYFQIGQQQGNPFSDLMSKMMQGNQGSRKLKVDDEMD